MITKQQSPDWSADYIWSTDRRLIVACLHRSSAVLHPRCALCSPVRHMLMCHAHRCISNWLHYAHHTLSHGVCRTASVVAIIPHQIPAREVRKVRQRHDMLFFALMHHLVGRRSGDNRGHFAGSWPDMFCDPTEKDSLPLIGQGRPN